MYKSFTKKCPSKDKTVTVDVDYIDASSLEKKAYIKGRIISCTGSDGCKQCPLYGLIPNEILM